MEAQIDVRAPGAEGRPLRLAALGDERLARLVGSGSESAFATLYERYHQPLYRYCRSMLRDDADAQDALQSAFAGALVALRRGQRDAPLRPWLYRIAHNEAISLLRRRRPQDEFSEASEVSTASAQDVAEDRARLALLLADLRELPERQRGALVMRELSGLSHGDVALALGISVGAAKQTVFEARRSLAEFSEGRAMPCDEICRTVSDGDGRALRTRRIRAHLRECSGCAAFAAAIPARAADLRVLAPPLPAVAAAGLLARIATGGSAPGSGGAGAAVAATAGKSVGMAVATKAVAGAALLASVVAGVTVVLHHPTHPARGSLAAQVGPTGPGGSSAGRTPVSSGASAGGLRGGASPTGTHSTRGGPAGHRGGGAAARRHGSASRSRSRSARVLAAAQLRRSSSRNNLASSPSEARSGSAGARSGRSTHRPGADRSHGSGREGAITPGARAHGRTKHHDRPAGRDHRAEHHDRRFGEDHRAKHHHRHAG